MVDKYKKVLNIVFIMITMLFISGCGHNERFSEEIFCDYYKSATYFDELQPLVCKYLNVIDSSFEKSDKTNFDTFEYDEKELEELYDAIEGYSDKIMNAENPNTDENLANLGLIYYCTKIQADIAEKDLKSVIGTNNDTEWYENLKNNLDESYNDFRNHEKK